MKQQVWPDSWAPKPNVSHSSLNTFDECRRKYWLMTAPSEIRTKFPRAYKVERNLVNDYMVVGQVVDETIKRGLRNYRGSKHWPEDLKTMGSMVLKELIAYSRDFTREMENPNAKIPFTDWGCLERIYYHEEYSDDEIRAKQSAISKCLENYEKSGFREHLVACWDFEWDIPLSVNVRPTPWFMLDGMPVYASYDFVMRGGGEAYVVDWKTGKRTAQTEEHARRQLHLYAAFVSDRYKIPLNKIQIGPAWLKESGFPEYTEVDPTLVEAITASWRGKYNEIVDLFAEAPHAEKLAAGLFPITTNLNTCRGCQFRSCVGYKKYLDSLSVVPVDDEELVDDSGE